MATLFPVYTFASGLPVASRVLSALPKYEPDDNKNHNSAQTAAS